MFFLFNPLQLLCPEMTLFTKKASHKIENIYNTDKNDVLIK